MTGDDSCLLVVTSSVARQLKDLSAQILEQCSEIHWSSRADTLAVVALTQMAVDTTNRKREERDLVLVPFALPLL